MWLTEIGAKLHEKLAAVGLVEDTGGAKVPTLGAWCRDYMTRQTHVKPASRLATEQAVRNLLDHFGEARAIDRITAGGADDFRKWLLSDGRSHRQGYKPRKLSGVTVAKRLQRCTAIFADAARRKILNENPFAGIKRPCALNKERQSYVAAATIERFMEDAPNAEWRLLLAMSRYLGVRVPSEPFSMTWACVDWAQQRLRISSPKTAGHGKSFRVVPILPQVSQHLEAVFEAAPVGSVYIFHALRERDSVKAAEKGFWMSLNLRQGLLRLLTRFGIQPWPRLWHNLRSSAQTDLANRFPAHVVCEWLGNTKAVAQDHYLQVTQEHFREAAHSEAQKAAQQVPVPISRE